MYFTDILNLLLRQSNWVATPSELKHKIDLDRRVGALELNESVILEELDYLLMARLIVGDDIHGYRLAPGWYELSQEAKTTWLSLNAPDSLRPNLHDPKSIYRRWAKRYKWELDHWFSFHFAVCQQTDDGDGDFVVVIINGLSQHRDRMDKATIRERISAALTRWYQTDEGLAAWNQSCGDFNIGDLASTCSPSLNQLLLEFGFKDLEFTSAGGDAEWQHDDILGTPPNRADAARSERYSFRPE
jgi:hypothetical protein